MSIWFWIIPAWLLSYLILDRKNVESKHLLWMLLPVDMYGINLFGVTVKPYMLFCLIMLLKRLAEGRTRLNMSSPWLLRGLFAVLACVVMNAINCPEPSSVLSTFMMLVVWGCTVIYLSECDSTCRASICKVLQATGIGYGLVFAAGYILMQFFPQLPGLMAEERSLPGIFMRNANMSNGALIATYRLRGFTIDPNTMIGTFLYCAVISLLQSVRSKSGFRDKLGLILPAVCVLLSGSRMGLICLLLCVVISLWIGYSINKNRVEKILLISFFVLLAGMIVLLITGTLQTLLTAFLLNYSNRSSLNDDYGRLTIWQEAATIWLENGLFLGIGMGQMQYYTSMGRSCHNSWLEILCAWGAVVGGAMLFHFATPILSGLRHCVTRPAARKDIFFWAMLLGTAGVIVSLVTVDNVTYSYLWFGLAMVAAISTGNWEVKNETEEA